MEGRGELWKTLVSGCCLFACLVGFCGGIERPLEVLVDEASAQHTKSITTLTLIVVLTFSANMEMLLHIADQSPKT